MILFKALPLVFLLASLPSLGGCQLPGRSDIPPEPPASRTRDRALLLDVDALQLAPGAGRNAWRTQGDGQLGF